MARGTWMGIALLLVAGPALAQDQIAWQTDIAKALKQAKAEQKLVLIHFYGDTCGPCKAVEKNVFPQPTVVQAVTPAGRASWWVSTAVRSPKRPSPMRSGKPPRPTNTWRRYTPGPIR